MDTNSIERPAAATHFLVRSRNADGEMTTGPSLRIDDDGVPTAAATSVSFTDTDPLAKKLSGKITVTRASNEAFISEYKIYWGSSATEKLPGSPEIARLARSLSRIEHTLIEGTSIPVGATHLLVRTKNADGEMATGVSTPINDQGVPENAAVSLAFTDTDTTGGEIAGTLYITKSANENDITDYVVYWGSSETQKLAGSAAIRILQAKGENLTHIFGANTPRPNGATHLLVRTKNASGEMATGAFVLIDDLGVPSAAAGSVSFTDTNLNGGKLGGTVSIVRATSETSIDTYELYWGSSTTAKLGTSSFASIPKSASSLSHTFPADTLLPLGATHILVRTKNSKGEMATGPNVQIVDKGVPEVAAAGVAFTDTNRTGRQLGGNVAITKAVNEDKITHYKLYWGSDSSTKLAGNATAITRIAKSGSNLTFTFPAGTALPTGATHLLVRTENVHGEMASGVSVLIVDLGVPVNAATALAFTDTDPVANKIGGTVNISKAASESDVSHYVLYWGFNSSTKLPGQPKIGEIARTGANLTFALTTGTAIPTGATHLLVRTKNADGEMATGPSVAITDL